MSHLTVRTIGEASVSIDDRTIGPSASRLLGLLLCLARHPGRRLTRASLSDLLFPNASGEAAATHSLRQLLYLAKREGACLQKDSDLVWLDASKVASDADEFFRDLSLRPKVTVNPDGTPSFELAAGADERDIDATSQQCSDRAHTVV